MLRFARRVGVRLVTAPRQRTRVPRPWATYDAQRARPRLRPVTVSREVWEAFEARKAAGESGSALVERALRREMGLPPAE